MSDLTDLGWEGILDISSFNKVFQAIIKPLYSKKIDLIWDTDEGKRMWSGMYNYGGSLWIQKHWIRTEIGWVEVIIVSVTCHSTEYQYIGSFNVKIEANKIEITQEGGGRQIKVLVLE